MATVDFGTPALNNPASDEGDKSPFGTSLMTGNVSPPAPPRAVDQDKHARSLLRWWRPLVVRWIERSQVVVLIGATAVLVAFSATTVCSTEATTAPFAILID